MSETGQFREGNESEIEMLGEDQGKRFPLGTLVLILFVIIAGYVALRSGRSRPVDQAVGKKLPKLELQSLADEDEIITLADLSGRVVLVNFWATWCPPCQEELPHILELEKKFRNQEHVVILPISSGQPEEVLQEATEGFVQANEVESPIYIDRSRTTEMSFISVSSMDGLVFPTTFILDGQGVVRGVWYGYASGVEKEMEELLLKLSSAKQSEAPQ